MGTILSVSPAGNSGGARISFRFDHIEIHHRRIPIVVDLRSMASFMEVEFAQIPETTPGFGTPYVWATTHQIGGDIKYGVGGPITDQWSHTLVKVYSTACWFISGINLARNAARRWMARIGCKRSGCSPLVPAAFSECAAWRSFMRVERNRWEKSFSPQNAVI